MPWIREESHKEILMEMATMKLSQEESAEGFAHSYTNKGEKGVVTDSENEDSSSASKVNYFLPSSEDQHSMDTPNTLEKYHKNSRIICLCAICCLLLLVSSFWPSQYKKDLKTWPELRLMMLSKSGAGKSAAGNTILGGDAFRSEASPGAVTERCQRETRTIQGRKITVIDTPAITDTRLASNKESECIDMSLPGLHVLMLVIRLDRFTEDETNAVKWIQQNFGDEALKHTMILFTGGDLLGGKPVAKFLNESDELIKFIQLFGATYHVMSNVEKRDRTQVAQLLTKIDLMIGEGENTFNISTLHLKSWRRSSAVEDEKCKVEKEREIREEEEQKREAAKKAIREVEKKRRLMKVRDLKEEEEWKRVVREREIRREEEEKRKMLEEENAKLTVCCKSME